MRKNLGLEPATTYMIVQTVITLVSMGLSYYSAVQYATQQSRIQKSLLLQEKERIAASLHEQYPNISFNDWLQVVTDAIYTLPGDGFPQKESDWTKYLPYAIIGIAIIFLVEGR